MAVTRNKVQSEPDDGFYACELNTYHQLPSMEACLDSDAVFTQSGKSSTAAPPQWAGHCGH